MNGVRTKMANEQTHEVILLDRTEMDADGSGAFMTVYNMDGTPYKIGAKRQELWGVFNNAQRYDPIILTFETFTPKGSTSPITFLAGAKAVTYDDIIQAALKNTLSKLLTASDDERVRSQSISYAKDLAVASVIKPAKIKEWAKTFFFFIKGVEDEQNKN